MIYCIVGCNFIHEKKNIYICKFKQILFPLYTIRIVPDEEFKIFRYPISLISYNTTPYKALPYLSTEALPNSKKKKKVHKQIHQF